MSWATVFNVQTVASIVIKVSFRSLVLSYLNSSPLIKRDSAHFAYIKQYLSQTTMQLKEIALFRVQCHASFTLVLCY